MQVQMSFPFLIYSTAQVRLFLVEDSNVVQDHNTSLRKHILHVAGIVP